MFFKHLVQKYPISKALDLEQPISALASITARNAELEYQELGQLQTKKRVPVEPELQIVNAF